MAALNILSVLVLLLLRLSKVEGTMCNPSRNEPLFDPEFTEGSCGVASCRCVSDCPPSCHHPEHSRHSEHKPTMMIAPKQNCDDKVKKIKHHIMGFQGVIEKIVIHEATLLKTCVCNDLLENFVMFAKCVCEEKTELNKTIDAKITCEVERLCASIKKNGENMERSVEAIICNAIKTVNNEMMDLVTTLLNMTDADLVAFVRSDTGLRVSLKRAVDTFGPLTLPHIKRVIDTELHGILSDLMALKNFIIEYICKLFSAFESRIGCLKEDIISDVSERLRGAVDRLVCNVKSKLGGAIGQLVLMISILVDKIIECYTGVAPKRPPQPLFQLSSTEGYAY